MTRSMTRVATSGVMGTRRYRRGVGPVRTAFPTCVSRPRSAPRLARLVAVLSTLCEHDSPFRLASRHRSVQDPGARRLRDGRERPVGAASWVAEDRRARRRRGGVVGRCRRRARARCALADGVRLLHGELEATRRRGALPHELQPRHPHPAAGRLERAGGADPVRRAAGLARAQEADSRAGRVDGPDQGQSPARH